MADFHEVSTREPYLSGSPQYTPWENNGDELVQHQGNPFVSQIVRQSSIVSRPSRWRPVFFLQPTGDSGRWGDWWAAAFLTEKEIFPNQRDTTAGGWLMQDQRRNVSVPATISYGDAVGEMNGYAPYGLDDGYE